MIAISFADLIAPLSVDDFFEHYWHKRPLVIKGNAFRKLLFSKVVTWQDFSDYLNNDRAVSGLQVVISKHRKLCMEKGNMHGGKDKPAWHREFWYDKEYLLKLWEEGNTLVLTKASQFSNEMNAVAGAVESAIPFSSTDAHFYCSAKNGAHAFYCHGDTDDNFLIHALGAVHWKVYPAIREHTIMPNGTAKMTGRVVIPPEEEALMTPYIDEILQPGDLLYIPRGVYHKATPMGPRISISIPVSLGSRRRLDRRYYDFTKSVFRAQLKNNS